MQVETISVAQKRLQRKRSVDDEGAISEDSDSVENQLSSEAVTNANYVCTEDEIGVTMDYDWEETENQTTARSRSPSTDRTQNNRHRRRRGRRREHHHRQSRRDRHEVWSKKWFIPFFSGIFMGLIFLIIGIVFIAYFTMLPDYIGILFILVSIPPFCMAINKYRTARYQAHAQRRMQIRRQALRDLRNRENGAYRNGSLPMPDNPPSYANLALSNENEHNVEAGRETRGSMWSITGNVLPSYDDATKTFKEKQNLSQKSSLPPEAELPKYEESDVEVEMGKEVTNFSSDQSNTTVPSAKRKRKSPKPTTDPSTSNVVHL